MTKFCVGGLIIAFVLMVGSQNIQAAIQYTTPGSTYSQNFDSLPITPVDASLQSATVTMPWADDTTPNANLISIPGWYLYHPIVPTSESGTNTHQRFRIGSGATATGAFYSYGTAGSTDRALTPLNADTLSTPQNATVPPLTQEESQMYAGLLLTNNSGSTLGSFTLGYTGEQWRRAGNGGATGPQVTDDILNFQYSLVPGATISSPNALYTNVSALNFASPQTTGAAAGIDGNAAANRQVFSPVTVSNIVWAPGTSLWLRWVDNNYPGPNPTLGANRGDNGLGIDDVSFSAAVLVPEPSSLCLLGLGALALVIRRRLAR
jgi:hypothetical protein